eukprot:7664699-Alexandrium_andersonii.AAC.1
MPLLGDGPPCQGLGTKQSTKAGCELEALHSELALEIGLSFAQDGQPCPMDLEANASGVVAEQPLVSAPGSMASEQQGLAGSRRLSTLRPSP